jgi:AcrR family transcriptional regulator
VLDAAAALFVERGWAGTAIRDIARVARVSVETVYSSVGPKAELLRAAIDISVVGDDDARPQAERPEFQALGRGSTRQRVAALGALLAGMFPRTAGLHRALQHAAPAEPALADVLAQTLARQRETTRLGAAAVAGRPPTDREVDGLHAVLSNDVYLQLTEHAGWSSETYQAWVGDIVVRLLDLDLDLT